MAKALKEPHELAGRKLTTGSCPECNRAVEIKANRNGIAYYYCQWPDIETGERCNNQGRFSPKMSAKLCTAYLNGSPVLHTAPSPTPLPLKETNEPANDNHAPHNPIATDQGRDRAEPEREPEPAAKPERPDFFGM